MPIKKTQKTATDELLDPNIDPVTGLPKTSSTTGTPVDPMKVAPLPETTATEELLTPTETADQITQTTDTSMAAGAGGDVTTDAASAGDPGSTESTPTDNIIEWADDWWKGFGTDETTLESLFTLDINSTGHIQSI